MRFAALFIVIALLTTSVALTAESEKSKEPEPQMGRWAVFDTNKGTFKIGLYEKDAPITTRNFIHLVEHKFYDGLKFHRLVPELIIQGGDPNGDGTGSSEKTIKLEVSPKLKHDGFGVVAMARRQDPDSASCQFYITLDAIPYLDGKYAVFGKVTEGADVIKKLTAGDVMKTVKIILPQETHKSSDKRGDKKQERSN